MLVELRTRQDVEGVQLRFPDDPECSDDLDDRALKAYRAILARHGVQPWPGKDLHWMPFDHVRVDALLDDLRQRRFNVQVQPELRRKLLESGLPLTIEFWPVDYERAYSPLRWRRGQTEGDGSAG